MPAQWPIFISNLTNKLVSRNSTGPEHIGQFVADEYYNAVQTSQTIFGNIHASGQKSILEVGFKKAFRMLYESKEPVLLDKFNNPPYDDMFEEFPGINLEYDPLCDMEKWINENTDTIDTFLFYQYFTSTCPAPGEEPNLTNVFGEISIDEESINSIDFENLKGNPEVTMKVTGGDGVAPYLITYSLNGKILKTTTDSQGVSKVEVPTDVGEYQYTFIGAIDSTGDIELINVNKSVSIKIEEGESGKTLTVSENTPRRLISEELDDESTRVIETSKRVLAQNDESDAFRRWVENIPINYNNDFLKAVRDQVIEWLDDGVTFPMVLNRRIFQDEHLDFQEQLPSWLSKEYICRFVYGPYNNYRKKNALETDAEYLLYLKISERIAMGIKRGVYDAERNKWIGLKRRWVTELSNSQKTEEDTTEGDAYVVMADHVIKYWQSTASQPFSSGPPIPPCNVPSPGQFAPVSYGDKQKLANDLRRAWNTGKRFDVPPSLQTAARSVSTAVAVAHAKHLKDIKFIYNGSLTVGTSTVPMVGFSPTTF